MSDIYINEQLNKAQKLLWGGSPIYETESLTKAVEYCYNLDKDFIVRTYAEWEMREMLADL